MSRLSPQWKGLPNAYKQPGRWTYADHLQYAEHLEDEAAERRRLRQEAREILAELHNEPLNNFAQPLRFEAEDAEIRTYAAKVAHAQGLAWAACLSMLSALPEGIEHHAAQLDAYARMSNTVRTLGIEPPRLKHTEPIAPALRRMACELWYRRKFRALVARRVERAAIANLQVSAKASPYCSPQGHARKQARKRANAELLASLAAVNELGEAFTLAELQEGSNANPVVRVGEMMVRLKGIQKVATERGDEALFITPTLHPKWHAVYERTGRVNPAWIAAGKPSPRDAQASHQARWEKCRAYLHKKGIDIYGVRVAEPHHDETPHWHMAVIIPKGTAKQVVRAFWLYWLPADADDTSLFHQARRAQRDSLKRKKLLTYEAALSNVVMSAARGSPRVKVERIRKANGVLDIAGYLAKYLAKNLNASQLQFRLEYDAASGGSVLSAENPQTAAERVQSWASIWGLRQFQFFGLPGIGLWREARRVDGKQADAPVIEAMRAPADASDYATHLAALGGPLVKRDDVPVLLWKVGQVDTNGLPVLNRYGDAVLHKPKGLQTRFANDNGVIESVLTRLHTWTVERLPEASAPLKGAPWTRVTNCNQPGRAPGTGPDEKPGWAGARAGPPP